jgi:sugar phosphate permease
VSDLKLGDTDLANMLGAFFPGYMITQIPSGPIIQKYGGKPLLLLVMLGTGLYTVLPAASRFSVGGNRSVIMVAVLAIMGMFQGPMSPCHGHLCAEWIPKGVERTWALKFLGLGHTACPLLAAALTPWLANRFGWRTACYVYGAANLTVGLLWQLLVPVNKVAATPEVAGGAAAAAAAAAAVKAKAEPVKTVEWAIFKHPAVTSLMVFQWCSDNCEFTLRSLGPTFFMESFKITAVEMGRYMAVAQIVHVRCAPLESSQGHI